MGFSGILSNRHDLYLLGLVLGLANVGFQHAVQDAVLRGFWPALSGLFDISAMIWAALLAMAVILHSAPEGQHAGSPRSSRLDYIWVGLVVLACLLPIKLAAALATSLLAVWGMITAKPRSPVFRGSAIALSIVAALFWGGVLLTASGTALLRIDVALAATFSGLHSESNLLYFASSDPAFAGKGFLVAQGCSSLHGMSIAILAFVLVTQFYNLPAKPATVVWGLLGVAATIAVNIARLSIMGHFPAYYEWVHLGPGAVIAGMVGMILVLLANLGGNWRAITRNG